MRLAEFQNVNKELESALVNTLTQLRGEADDANVPFVVVPENPHKLASAQLVNL